MPIHCERSPSSLAILRATGLHQRLLQTLQQNVFGQINANEYHFAAACFVTPPLRPQIAPHQLVNALENDLAISTLHVQNTFVAQHAGTVDINDGTQEVFQLSRVKRTV